MEIRFSFNPAPALRQRVSVWPTACSRLQQVLSLPLPLKTSIRLIVNHDHLVRPLLTRIHASREHELTLLGRVVTAVPVSPPTIARFVYPL